MEEQEQKHKHEYERKSVNRDKNEYDRVNEDPKACK